MLRAARNHESPSIPGERALSPLAKLEPALLQAHSLWLLAGSLVLSVILTALLYGNSLSYGFMFDDPLDLPRASGRSYLSILTSAGESTYYRPLILALWKALYDLFSRNDAPTLHVLVLLSHAANGVLVYLVGSRLHGRVGGYVSAALFISFPFSYQAVANVNAFFHPLVTTFLLLSVVLYFKWRDSHSRALLALSGAAALLAVFTHEYGVAIAPLILAGEAYWLLVHGKRRPSYLAVMFVGISLGFLLIWWVVPKWQHTWGFDFESLRLNSAYFFQGLVYPVIYGIPAVALMIGLHVFARRALSLGFALAWAVVGFLPSLFSLPFSYVIDSPRLLYLPSVGIALAWAGTLSAPFHWRLGRARILAIVVGLGMAGLIVAQSVLFVQARNTLFAQGAKAVRKLVETAIDPQRPGRTYVNFPSWLALKSTDYALGHSGVTMVPSYIGLGRVVYIQTGQSPEIVSAAYDAVARSWDYNYGVHGNTVGLDELEKAFRRGGGVYATRFYSNTLDIEYVGEIETAQAEPQMADYAAQFGTWGRLVSAKVQPGPEAVDITLEWESLRQVEKDYTVFVHIYNASNKILAQSDGYPIGEMFPIQRWRPGDHVEDHRCVVLPPGAPPGDYRVVVGVYDRQNGERALAVDASGVEFADDAVSIAQFALPR